MSLGLLRLLLSLMVIDQHYGLFRGHVQPWLLRAVQPLSLAPIGEGAVAVTGFFVLSGYLIGWILEHKYQPERYGLAGFYASRAVRIYPLYLLVLAVQLGAHAYTVGADIPLHTLFDNVTLLPYAATMMWGQRGMVTTLDIGSRFLLPQAWTVSLDLLFYLVAPMLLNHRRRRRVALAALLAAALVLAAVARTSPLWFQYFYSSGFIYLFAFLLGAEARSWSGRATAPFIAATVAALFAAYLPIVLPPAWWQLVAAAAFAYIVRHLHATTRSSGMDRLFSDLTYPLYLTHLPLMWLFRPGDDGGRIALTLGITLVVSLALMYAFERPLDRWRNHLSARLVRAAAPAGAATPRQQGAWITDTAVAGLVLLAPLRNDFTVLQALHAQRSDLRVTPHLALRSTTDAILSIAGPLQGSLRVGTSDWALQFSAHGRQCSWRLDQPPTHAGSPAPLPCHAPLVLAMYRLGARTVIGVDSTWVVSVPASMPLIQLDYAGPTPAPLTLWRGYASKQ
jgi:peptidoglycan/LPS O-acetylase OafA/YrhL